MGFEIDSQSFLNTIINNLDIQLYQAKTFSKCFEQIKSMVKRFVGKEHKKLIFNQERLITKLSSNSRYNKTPTYFLENLIGKSFDKILIDFRAT